MYNVCLFYGYGGATWSGPLANLGVILSALPNVDWTFIAEYPTWQEVAGRINRFRDPTVIIGHSYGASAALGAAKDSGREVPLVVTIDPSQWVGFFIPASWSIRSIPLSKPRNVKRAMNFYQASGIIGRQTVSGAENTLIENSSHTGIVKDSRVWNPIIKAIRELP